MTRALAITRTGLLSLSRQWSRARRVQLIALVAIWAVVVLTQIIWHENYQPDGLYYTDMTLRWSGMSPHDAAVATQAWYAHRGVHVKLWYFDPSVNHDWLLVKPRLVYSALSVPFAWLFGIRGMLVIPNLAFLFTTLAVFYLARSRSGAGPALAAVLLMLLSPFLQIWGTSTVTDTVLMGWAALLMLLLPRRCAAASRARTIAIVAVVLLMCFTRQAGPMPAAILLFGWLWRTVESRRWRNEWTAITVSGVSVAAAATVFISWWSPYPMVTAMTRETGYKTLHDAVVHYPLTLARMVYSEILSMERYDRSLLLLILLALIGVALRVRRLGGWLAVVSLVALVLVAALNGNTYDSFRYLMPSTPFLAVIAASAVQRLFIAARRLGSGPAGGSDDAARSTAAGDTAADTEQVAV